MAGVGDRAFREICKSFGAAATYGELTSSKGISMQSDKSKELIKIGDEDRPFFAQNFRE
jgi:tRNA-dihydrouridine synthase